MKLVTYDAGSGARVGRLDDGQVLDVGFDGDMVAFIEAGAPVRDERPVDGARLLAPLRPRTMRDFLSFRGHMENALGRLGLPIPEEWYEIPSYYKGMPDTVIGPDAEIPWPSYTDRLDHELELAAVVGKPGRDIPRERALDHVFGWTIWNDLSARDVQAKELKIGLGPAKGKDWDGSNVLGPCIVTSDELDVSDLRMSVRVNGETWGEDTTANMHHSFADLIAYASLAQMLHPGELLGSGTAAGGSGLELDRWLQPGDEVELEIEGIGILRNRIGTKGA
ncbi:MAG: fumarylacetoacetate hydrolase family protein [Actinobacteria bacterium]|nr:MAG: fumarylacetoacetate hydrolase family protein [Actinomycetota bacterium]